VLGSISEAEDTVQEAFARLVEQDLDEIDDVRGWLTVVVSRLCFDRLRSADRQRRSSTDLHALEPRPAQEMDPADRITLDDEVRLALHVVMTRLTPAERIAFVLHDVFSYSFDAISEIVGRSPAACRQLASRARRTISPHRPALQRARLVRHAALAAGHRQTHRRRRSRRPGRHLQHADCARGSHHTR
jgi:RNA polymerase sigma-70 factor (ECF subfamily)